MVGEWKEGAIWGGGIGRVGCQSEFRDKAFWDIDNIQCMVSHLSTWMK